MSAVVAWNPEQTVECGGCHRILTPPDWYALRFVGRWATDEGALELRICTCGSCISRKRPTLVSRELPAVRERESVTLRRVDVTRVLRLVADEDPEDG
ncbi:MAG: hypothetical protein JWP87_1254 [Labilithrix sp.]|nr:hypothetical protein [Labilithrix sp.]